MVIIVVCTLQQNRKKCFYGISDFQKVAKFYTKHVYTIIYCFSTSNSFVCPFSHWSIWVGISIVILKINRTNLWIHFNFDSIFFQFRITNRLKKMRTNWNKDRQTTRNPLHLKSLNLTVGKPVFNSYKLIKENKSGLQKPKRRNIHINVLYDNNCLYSWHDIVKETW